MNEKRMIGLLLFFVELPIPEAKSSLLPWASTSSLGQLLSETAFLP